MLDTPSSKENVGHQEKVSVTQHRSSQNFWHIFGHPAFQKDLPWVGGPPPRRTHLQLGKSAAHSRTRSGVIKHISSSNMVEGKCVSTTRRAAGSFSIETYPLTLACKASNATRRLAMPSKAEITRMPPSWKDSWVSPRTRPLLAWSPACVKPTLAHNPAWLRSVACSNYGVTRLPKVHEWQRAQEEGSKQFLGNLWGKRQILLVIWKTWYENPNLVQDWHEGTPKWKQIDQTTYQHLAEMKTNRPDHLPTSASACGWPPSVGVQKPRRTNT